ncbi:MAG: dual specificity protein phosphatase family protein [Chloroflexota bacterium]
MKVDIYWIREVHDGRLAIMPRPRAGEWLEDELKAWRNGGIDVVVSLLTPGEIAELELRDEPKICQDNRMEYISYPIHDRQVPISQAATMQLIEMIQKRLKQGKGVAIHCRMGVGRSALIAACVMVSQGFELSASFEAIGKARGIQVPDTDEQKRWAEVYSKNLTSKPYSGQLPITNYR